MNRFAKIALAAVAAATFALPALAAGPDNAGRKPHEKRERGEHVEKAQFPVAAADFRQRVEQRIAKITERTEKRIAEKKLTAEQAQAERARVNAAVAKVTKALDEATADGTVTAEEAKQVREASKGLHHKRGDKKPAPAQRLDERIMRARTGQMIHDGSSALSLFVYARSIAATRQHLALRSLGSAQHRRTQRHRRREPVMLPVVGAPSRRRSALAPSSG